MGYSSALNNVDNSVTPDIYHTYPLHLENRKTYCHPCPFPPCPQFPASPCPCCAHPPFPSCCCCAHPAALASCCCCCCCCCGGGIQLPFPLFPLTLPSCCGGTHPALGPSPAPGLTPPPYTSACLLRPSVGIGISGMACGLGVPPHTPGLVALPVSYGLAVL
jgi:hypothetical protein